MREVFLPETSEIKMKVAVFKVVECDERYSRDPLMYWPVLSKLVEISCAPHFSLLSTYKPVKD